MEPMTQLETAAVSARGVGFAHAADVRTAPRMECWSQGQVSQGLLTVWASLVGTGWPPKREARLSSMSEPLWLAVPLLPCPNPFSSGME